VDVRECMCMYACACLARLGQYRPLLNVFRALFGVCSPFFRMHRALSVLTCVTHAI